ncbi:hypothetical protein I871_01695 [Borrelia miyamotoi LB-2001]|nr:hypothetical protein I871_01695 [Borrelia miyamotoi LB-2001]
MYPHVFSSGSEVVEHEIKEKTNIDTIKNDNLIFFIIGTSF